VQVVGIHGTYSDSFPLIRSVSPALIIFLGSTIGNFTPAEERIFWSDVTANMQPDDYFLLGVDLIKDVDLLEAAYNDRAGITARFTKNYFARMNRELGAAIDLDTVEHKAWYNPEKEQVEIYGQFHDNLEIYIQPLNQSHDIGRGETILLEISRKFNLTGVQESLTGYGLQPVRTYTDPQGWFGLLLLEKKGP
jgi:L-histidine N-alpha-methyltransferase